MACADCFSGSIHEGSPAGEVTEIHGLKAYLSRPSVDVARRGVIIVIPDAFGWEFVNNRLLADHYAKKGGYLVYLPDFMKGHAAPISSMATMRELMQTSSVLGWLKAPYLVARVLISFAPFIYHNGFGSSWPIVLNFFKSVREGESEDIPIYAAGFCWGGKHAVNLANGVETSTDGKPLINAAFTGHPSMLKIPSEIEAVKIPTSFAFAEKDHLLSLTSMERIRKIVETQPETTRGEVKMYEGAGHGFCVRADLREEGAREQAAEAEDQALAWFDKHRS